MKKIIFVALLIITMTPLFSFAYMEGYTKDAGAFYMMRSIEDRALGDELHEEMEDLMIKMMSGSMNEEEAQRMVELMNEYPGVQGIMMGRMMMANYSDNNYGWSGMTMPWGMMSGSWGLGLFSWFGALLSIVWLLVGVLAMVWLWKKISNK